MLTSAAHYLSPEYLSPLSASPDNKKSPLALLAQTCSSIGKDASPPKSVTNLNDKKDVIKEENKSDNKLKEKHQEAVDYSDKNDNLNSERKNISPSSHKSLTLKEKECKSSSQITSIHKSSKLPERKESHKSNEHIVRSSSNPSVSTETSSRNSPHDVPYFDTSKNSPVSNASGLYGYRPEHVSSHLSYHPTLYPGLPGYMNHSIESAFSMHLHQQALAAHNSLNKSSGLPSTSHGLSPHSYSKVKSSSGSTTLIPICRDPYCKSCPAQSSLGSSPCPAGCTQCSEKSHLSIPSPSLTSGLSSPLRSLPGLDLASSMYPYGTSTPHHTQPYVCNWISGSKYCGQRFTTSEELFAHLRTHTSSNDTLSALSAYHASLGINPAALAASSYPSLSLASNPIHAAYPRSLSPNSLLSASRYHPYKSQLTAFPPPSGLHGLPSSIPFYSPYSLYGPRLGSVP